MAIVNNGTLNGLPAEKLPSGYTLPTVTTISDFMYRYDHEVSIVTANVLTNVSPATNMATMVTATNTAVTAILAADFLATATVTAYSVITGLEFNLGNPSPKNFSNAITPSYLVSVTTYVKAV